MNQETKREITIEDLIRLKKCERPAADFWESFDRELRAKQLAALVEKRPWWRTLSLPRALGSFSRYHLSFGAAALLAITYVATREGRIDRAALEAGKADVVAMNDAGAEVAPSTTGMSSTARVLPSPVLALVDRAPNASELVAENATVEATPALTESVSRRLDADTPSARYIAANLRAAQQAEPLVARGLLAQAQGFEARALPAKATVEPLAQMTTPASARIAKLSSAMAVSFSDEKATRTSDRVARRLSSDGDDRLYETVSRLDARGDKLGWKF